MFFHIAYQFCHIMTFDDTAIAFKCGIVNVENQLIVDFVEMLQHGFLSFTTLIVAQKSSGP